MEQKKIDRINELAKKAKTPEGLTPEELEERTALRQEYLDSVLGNLRRELDNTQKLIETIQSINKDHDISLLINNAGVGYYGLHEELNPQKISQMVRTNLEAPMIITNLLLRDLKKNAGIIVNTSSVTAGKSNPHGCVYGATKAGLTSFSHSLFDQMREYLFNVCDIGTGKTAVPAGYLIGGKTGTAEMYPRKTGNYVVSFIGFAPVDDPQVAIYVVIDRPNVDSQPHSSFAQEIANNILTEILPYMQIFRTEEISEEDEEHLKELGIISGGQQEEAAEGEEGAEGTEGQTEDGGGLAAFLRFQGCGGLHGAGAGYCLCLSVQDENGRPFFPQGGRYF